MVNIIQSNYEYILLIAFINALLYYSRLLLPVGVLYISSNNIKKF